MAPGETFRYLLSSDTWKHRLTNRCKINLLAILPIQVAILSCFSRKTLKLLLPFYINVFVCRKALNHQRETSCTLGFTPSIVQQQKPSTPPPKPHTPFPPLEKCLSCPTWKPNLGSLGCHFFLNYAEKKKNQMSFCTLESNCRPYHPFPPTLCNLYTGFQWNTPSTNVLCIWQTASSALTLFFVNKETKFPIHKRTNHFIFWVNESVFDLS